MPMRWTSTRTVAVVAFWAIAVTAAAFLPMTDPDTWWHVRVGREILATGSVPRVDEWSIAGQGRPWVSQDWASNAILAWLYNAGGPTLVSIAYGAVTTLAFLVLWNAVGVRAPSVGWLARAAWLLFGLVLAAPVLGARVQVIDLLLAALTLNVLWRIIRTPQTWHLGALPAIAVAWVNLHAGWPLLFLLGGAVVVGELAEGWRRSGAGGVRTAIARSGILAFSLGASAAVLAVNPNGLAIYAYPIDTLRISALASFVGEWQPARLSAPAGQLLAVFIVGAILPALLFGRERLRVSDALILLGLAYMAVTAVRFLLFVGPIGSTIVCIALAPAISSSKPGAAFAPVMDRLARAPRGRRAYANLALSTLLVVIGVGIAIARVGTAGQEQAIGDVMPVEAVRHLEAKAPGDRIFNLYEWGGYLGLMLPDRLIFIDGRADVYGDETIREYVEVISVNVDPHAYFVQHGIDHVLYPPDTTLGRWLDDSDWWRRAYADSVAAVWVAD